MPADEVPSFYSTGGKVELETSPAASWQRDLCGQRGVSAPEFMKLRILLPSLLALAAIPASAQKKYEVMDYGRFLSASIYTSQEPDYKKVPAAQTTSKGIAIKLGADAEGTMVFDTDLL